MKGTRVKGRRAPREQLRFVRALACERAARKGRSREVIGGGGREGRTRKERRKRGGPRRGAGAGGQGQKGWQEGTFRTFFVC